MKLKKNFTSLAMLKRVATIEKHDKMRRLAARDAAYAASFPELTRGRARGRVFGASPKILEPDYCSFYSF